MKRALTAVALAAALCGCDTLTPPATPSGAAWGVPYRVEIVPDGTLAPLVAQTTGYRVRVEQRHAQNVFVVAHELAHVWQFTHADLMREWAGEPCIPGNEGRCTTLEAHADAVGMAAVIAGCYSGDLGWPGGHVGGCIVPDPGRIRPGQVHVR